MSECVLRRDDIVLMLTATIDPGPTPLVARNDPQTRHRDYLVALESWLVSGLSNIVFVENSGYDLSKLVELASRHPQVQTQFVSLAPEELTGSRGKGYGELTLMQAAFERSVVLREATFIAKCTGRLRLLNIESLLQSLEGAHADLYCTFKRNLTFADSRFFIARPAIIQKHLFPLKDSVDDRVGFFFENALARASTAAIAGGFRWNCFPVFPYIAGISGTFGTRMTDSPMTRLSKRIYHLLRRYIYEH